MAVQDADRGRGERLQMTECPVCGADLRGYIKTSRHFYNEHGPEDFGLSPLGTRDADVGGEKA